MVGGVSRPRAAVLLVLVLALGACTADSDPPPDTPASSSAPASPSTSAAGDPTDAFRAWVRARNRALEAGDISTVEALSSDRCRTCQNSIDPIQQVYAEGGHFDTDGWVVDSATVKRQSGQKARISAAITYADGETIPSAGADPVTYGTERHIVLVDLEQLDGQWLLTAIEYVS